MLIIIAFAITSAGIYLALNWPIVPQIPSPSPIACSQEAKLCPDGSGVGRTGPNCEFAACPTPSPISVPLGTPCPPGTVPVGITATIPGHILCSPKPTPTPAPVTQCTKDSDCSSSQYICQATQGSGTACPNSSSKPCAPTYTIIKGDCKLKEGNKCGVDSDCAVGNLCHKNICTSPVGKQCAGPSDTSCSTDFQCVQGCGPPIARQYDPPIPYYCQLKGYTRPCPICLAEDTLIDTPSGTIPVQNLQQGTEVWTINSAGIRVSAKILKTSRTPVPSTHHVVHLVLADGRELFASPGHPTADGRTIGNLIAGDMLDGSHVITAQSIPYQKQYTYDLLPAGQTGSYWANHILVGSTLFSQ